MDIRQKLVELQMQAQIGWTKEEFADYLIANGVTVQEWISVKDRLPAVGEDVLVITSSSDRNMAVWRLFGNATNRQAHWEDEVGDGLVLGAATHWMPLPQPPKGETTYCKDCENLMFSDCYGECAKGHKGGVNPNDTCEHAKRKPPKGE